MNLFKKYTKILALMVIMTIFSTVALPNIVDASNDQKYENNLILDNESKNELPYKYRIINSLKISGSSQINPNQIKNMKANIKNSQIFIVDLRDELHGFINNSPVSFYEPNKDLTKDLSTSKILANETLRLASIPKGDKLTLHSRNAGYSSSVFIESVLSESTVVRNNNLIYVRFASSNENIPSIKTIDQFVSFVKYQVPNTHLHFHCDNGEYRTTLFMSMYQMMKNKNNLPLKEILDYQYKIGGISLLDNPNKEKFLTSFYKYSLENINTNFRVPYSQWIKNQ
ncbi:hypothetical protein [Clostridium cylindrosporum]|uniref:Dual specificity protein phosphatase n=1 Tax=Clostridium cylindrosporum DSM 605 TaxID=1121307 RepID=A0A0J8D797_CLOCY|nr:hypothetical protein [Clostridium cylindrosporum]KMT21772.1 dual specificity protein phosphatase [Clostridium cylindrosporum DSM 605]